MKYITENDQVIRKLSQKQYVAEFGVTFKQSRDRDNYECGLSELAGMAPYPHDSLSDLLDVLDCMRPNEVANMINAQTNETYKRAIRARDISLTDFDEQALTITIPHGILHDVQAMALA